MHTAPLENRVLPVDCHATPMDTSTPTTETHTQLEDTTLIDCEAIQKDITNPQGGASFYNSYMISIHFSAVITFLDHLLVQGRPLLESSSIFDLVPCRQSVGISSCLPLCCPSISVSVGLCSFSQKRLVSAFRTDVVVFSPQAVAKPL